MVMKDGADSHEPQRIHPDDTGEHAAFMRVCNEYHNRMPI